MARNRPPFGNMVWWRFLNEETKAYRFGYCTYVRSYNIIRLGRYAGDTLGGHVVDIADIEWRPY